MSPDHRRRRVSGLAAQLIALALAISAAACHSAETPSPDAGDPVPSVPGLADTSQAGLVAFAMSGEYKSWTAEPMAHPSAGPHSGPVRTFFNDVVAASLRAGTTPHPRGSILVKELMSEGDTVAGYAIDVKIKDGDGADTWLFCEVFGPDSTGYYGVANSTCTGCHSGGQDYVLTSLP
jgi:hypothetical protein